MSDEDKSVLNRAVEKCIDHSGLTSTDRWIKDHDKRDLRSELSSFIMGVAVLSACFGALVVLSVDTWLAGVYSMFAVYALIILGIYIILCRKSNAVVNKLVCCIMAILLLSVPAMAADTTIPTVSSSVSVLDDSVRVYGTASDTSGDANVTAGISRVELKIDDDSWTTASETATFNYTRSGLALGYHVVGVRAIDLSFNPSAITYTGFTITSESDDTDELEDLSWYISLKDLHFETVEDVFDVRTVQEGVDVLLSFEIDNEADTDRKLRYRITRGTFEVEDDIIVKSGQSEEIEEWIVGSVLSMGTNRFTIEVDDWDSRETVVEKSVSITVIEQSVKPVSVTDSEIPAWFIDVAKANNLTLTQVNTADLGPIMDRLDEMVTLLNEQKATITTQQTEIATLQSKVAGISTPQTVQPAQPAQKDQMINGIDNGVLIVLLAAGIAYWKRKEIFGGNGGNPPESDDMVR